MSTNSTAIEEDEHYGSVCGSDESVIYPFLKDLIEMPEPKKGFEPLNFEEEVFARYYRYCGWCADNGLDSVSFYYFKDTLAECRFRHMTILRMQQPIRKSTKKHQ